MTYEAAFEMYREQIEILKNAGVDLIVAETMINIEETLAAVDAASTVCQLPIMCTMTVDADGSIFSGGNAIEAAGSGKNRRMERYCRRRFVSAARHLCAEGRQRDRKVQEVGNASPERKPTG